MKWIAALLAAALLFCGCQAEASREEPQVPEQDTTLTEPVPEEPAAEPEEPPAEPEEPTTPEEPEVIGPAAPSSAEEVTELFRQVITNKQASITLDVSGMSWQFDMVSDLKNAYYAVTSQWPELKYAYDLQVEATGETAVCTFSYMPYQMGAYDAGVPEGSVEIACLKDVYRAADQMLDGRETLPIAITDVTLEVDDIQRALGQCGYGFLSYNINRDATAIEARAGIEADLSSSVAAIEETRRLAQEALEQIIKPEMTERETIEAIYQYVTTTVEYDWRYYNDPASMPQISTTAMGALRDGVAICGGYSWAMKTMLDACGIESYTVSGYLGAESHAWNYVLVDGKGYYCDPTSDRGGGTYRFLLTAEELEETGGYTWDDSFYSRLQAK